MSFLRKSIKVKDDERAEALSRQELFELYRQYEAVLKDELVLCSQYLNFYIGLLSAFLTGTLAGLVLLPSGDIRGLFLLSGPVLIGVFARLGYLNIKVFYRRFAEAWVITINLESILHMRYCHSLNPNTYPSRYKSACNGFMPEIGEGALKKVFDKALRAEAMVKELEKVGYTRRYAKWTFLAFGGVGLLLFVGILLYTALPYVLRMEH